MNEFKAKGDAPTVPPVLMGWMEFLSIFGDITVDQRDDGNIHLTNYQEVIVRLHNTWAANKEMAYGNAELINKLRKKVKKLKKANKADMVVRLPNTGSDVTLRTVRAIRDYIEAQGIRTK